MQIILVRHYKVNIKHKKWLNSEEYSKYCSDYNISPIIDQVPPSLPNLKLYASTMKRAKETAKLATGRDAEIIEGVHEVTFNGFLKSDTKLPFSLWEFLARLQWYTNNKKQKETLSMTIERLNKAIKKLIDKDEDCIIVMHSIAMRVLSRILISMGFKGKKLYIIKNGSAFIYEK